MDDTRKPAPRSGFKWKSKDPKDPKDSKSRDRPHRKDRDADRARDTRYDSYRARSPADSSRDRNRDRSRSPAPASAAAPADAAPASNAEDDARPDSELTEEELADRNMRRIFSASEVAAYDKAEAAKPAAGPATGKAKKPKTESATASAPPAGTEPTIIVNVNDRLGRKAAIPMLPSDKIKHLKIFVAATLGLQEGTFVLKRQGMAPFKDHISLADYEIGHGVQLDLEPSK